MTKQTKRKFKIVNYIDNVWYVAPINDKMSIDNYTPLLNIHFIEDKFFIKNGILKYNEIEDLDLINFTQDAKKYLEDKYPKGQR